MPNCKPQFLTLIDKIFLKSAETGGLRNGFLYRRRESVDVEDLFIAHIVGMDTMARGLRNAQRIIEANTLTFL